MTLWDLGQRFGMPKLQNTAMRGIVPAIHNASRIPWFTKFAYEEGYGTQRKHLRELVVAKLVAMDSENFRSMIDDMPDILKNQVMAGLKRHVDKIPEEHHARIDDPRALLLLRKKSEGEEVD